MNNEIFHLFCPLPHIYITDINGLIKREVYECEKWSFKFYNNNFLMYSI